MSIQDLLSRLRRSGPPATRIEDRRAAFEELAAEFAALPDGVAIELVSADGVPAEMLRHPQVQRDDAALLFLHGGGFTVGSATTHRGLVAKLSAASGIAALSVDYRLAPEHPFPAGLEDAARAYRWLSDRLGPAGRIVLAGDSAGGGLALSLALAIRDRGWAPPVGLVLMSPWTDLTLSGRSLQMNSALDPLVQPASAAASVERYLGPEGSRTQPLASPLHADLGGLPPLLIQVGLDESLLDDSLRLAARARRAGVQAVLSPWEGMIHIWPFFADVLPEGRAAIAEAGAFVREILAA